MAHDDAPRLKFIGLDDLVIETRPYMVVPKVTYQDQANARHVTASIEVHGRLGKVSVSLSEFVMHSYQRNDDLNRLERIAAHSWWYGWTKFRQRGERAQIKEQCQQKDAAELQQKEDVMVKKLIGVHREITAGKYR